MLYVVAKENSKKGAAFRLTSRIVGFCAVSFMKKETWIIVANSSYAKVYRAENNQTLVEVEALEHPESRLDDKELVSSKQGRTNASTGFQRSSMEYQTTPKHQEFHLFAREISHYLEKAWESGKVGRLYVGASPAFLGILRQTFSRHVNDLIGGEIDRDLTHLKPAEVRDHLPPVL